MTDLSYPNISFRLTTVGPAPQTRAWRDTIGVVGEFGTGPLESKITSFQQFVALYGQDNTSGSIAVQQASELGASNFEISRALPESTSSTAVIGLAAGNADLEPVVGYESTTGNTNAVLDETNYTTGLALELNYVGSPLARRLGYDEIYTLVTKINHANVSGRYNLKLFVTDYVDGASQTNPVYHPSTWSITATAVSSNTGELQILKVSKTDVTSTHDINEVLSYLKPGYVLTDDTTEYLILAAPYSLDSSNWALLVQNNTSSSAGAIADLQVKFPASGSYIIGYQLEFVDSLALTPYTANREYYQIPGATYNDGYNTYSIDSYFAIPETVTSDINFAYQISPSTGVTSEVKIGREDFGSSADEGIRISFGSDTKPTLLQGGQYIIPFAKRTVVVGSSSPSSDAAYVPGVTAAKVLRDLRNAILSDAILNSLISDAQIYALIPPYSLTLTSRLLGTEANRLYLKLSRYVAGTANLATDLNVLMPSGSSYALTGYGTYDTFSGAMNGPVFAYKDMYSLDSKAILRIQALSPGQSGNYINFTITPEEVTDNSALFTITVTDTNKAIQGRNTSETFFLNNQEIDFNTGEYLATRSSSLIKAFFLPVAEPGANSQPLTDATYQLLPLRQAPALGRESNALNTGSTAVSAQSGSYIRNVYLAGGLDYQASGMTETQAKAAGYLSAVKRLKNKDIDVLVVAGIPYGSSTYADVFAEAKNQVETSTVTNGLRRAVFEAPAGSSASRLQNLTGSLNSSRVILVRGQTVFKTLSGSTVSNASGIGYYAGILAVRPPFASPASSYGNIFPRRIQTVDTQSDSSYLDAVTKAYTELLFYNNGQRVFKFLNGRTTLNSNTDSKRYVSVVRIFDKIYHDLYDMLQWILSENNTRELQSKVASSVDAYLSTLLRNGYIFRLAPTICNEQNNSNLDMIQGRLNIQIRLTTTFPADFIGVDVIEDLTENFSFPTIPTGN